MSASFYPFENESSSFPPSGTATLITDKISTSASFLITHVIGQALRHQSSLSNEQEQQERQVILVGVSDTYEHYNAVLKKYGIQISSPKNKDRFIFIDAMELIRNSWVNQEKNDMLTSIIEQIYNQLNQENIKSEPLVVIDDLTSLCWTNCTTTEQATKQALSNNIKKFVNFYKALISLAVDQRNGSLLCVWHSDNSDLSDNRNVTEVEQISVGLPYDPVDRYVLNQLVHTSHLWIQLRSLQSQLKGEIIVHRGPSLLETHPELHSTTKSHTTQYELQESGPLFYAKGMARWSL